MIEVTSYYTRKIVYGPDDADYVCAFRINGKTYVDDGEQEIPPLYVFESDL